MNATYDFVSPAEGKRARDEAGSGRDGLLDTAVRLFAERGIANTTVAQIAQACKVTPAMVYYWFDTREKLYDAVVDERLAPQIGAIWDAIGEGGEDSAEDMVLRIVRRMIDVTEQAPWLPSLWLREIVQVGGLLQERLFRRLPEKQGKLFRQRIEKAQAAGELSADLAPDLLFISMLAMVMLPLAAAPGWRKVGKNINVDRHRIESHACALLSAGMRGVSHLKNVIVKSKGEKS